MILHVGHRLLAHRRDYHTSGVAMLIRRNHVQNIKQIIYISDRVMTVDMQMGCKMIRTIRLHLPRAGYPWDEYIQSVNQLSQCVAEAFDEGKSICIGGYFDSSLNIGARGDVLEDRCNQYGLCIDKEPITMSTIGFSTVPWNIYAELMFIFIVNILKYLIVKLVWILI